MYISKRDVQTILGKLDSLEKQLELLKNALNSIETELKAVEKPSFREDNVTVENGNSGYESDFKPSYPFFPNEDYRN